MNTHAFVVLQHRTLKHKKSCFPTTKVLASLGKVTLLIASLRNGRPLTADISTEEDNDLVLVLYGKIHYRLKICLQHGLDKTIVCMV